MKYHLDLIALAVGVILLATFFYPPTLEIYFGWADQIAGITR